MGVRRPLPVNVRTDDGAEDQGLHEVHGRFLSLRQPKSLGHQQQKENAVIAVKSTLCGAYPAAVARFLPGQARTFPFRH